MRQRKLLAARRNFQHSRSKWCTLQHLLANSAPSLVLLHNLFDFARLARPRLDATFPSHDCGGKALNTSESPVYTAGIPASASARSQTRASLCVSTITAMS